MPTTNYFRNFDQSNEQMLYEDLFEEFIKIHGIDTYYVHRNVVNRDPIFNEDALSTYTIANEIEMYVVNYDGYQGMGHLMNHGFPEIRDQMTFAVARKRFKEEMTAEAINKVRPMEGDLIYFPLQQRAFKITFVNDKPSFFQWGDLPLYQMNCDLYEYSGESFSTGIEGIDRLQREASINLLDHTLMDANNNPLMDANGDYLLDSTYTPETFDPLDQKTKIQDETDFIDFSETDPFSANGVY